MMSIKTSNPEVFFNSGSSQCKLSNIDHSQNISSTRLDSPGESDHLHVLSADNRAIVWIDLIILRSSEGVDGCQCVCLDHPPHVWLWVHEDKGQLSGHLATNRTQEQLHLDSIGHNKAKYVPVVLIGEERGGGKRGVVPLHTTVQCHSWTHILPGSR